MTGSERKEAIFDTSWYLFHSAHGAQPVFVDYAPTNSVLHFDTQVKLLDDIKLLTKDQNNLIWESMKLTLLPYSCMVSFQGSFR